MSNSNSITQDRLKELLDYNFDTGIFTRKLATARCVKVGDVAGSTNKITGYVELWVDGKKQYGHRIAWLYVYGEIPHEVDHINGIRSDNRISNLRKVTRKQNCQNRGAPSIGKSKLIGAQWNSQSNRWMSKICVNYKTTHLGFFDTPEEAHKAYLEAKKKYHEFQPELRNTKPA